MWVRYPPWCTFCLSFYALVHFYALFHIKKRRRQASFLLAEKDRRDSKDQIQHVENSGGMKMNIWDKAQSIQIQISEDIQPGFQIWFDKKIPTETREELCRFIQWVESNYRIPIPLWVDFAYRHYLVSREGKRVGYLFYWTDFSEYPVFNNPDDAPEIRLPVRTEYSTVEEILCSFIEAVSDYFAWICNALYEGYSTNESDTEEVLQRYLNSR